MRFGLALTMLAAGTALCADPPEAVQRQLRSVEAMKASIASQRLSIRKQTGRDAAPGSFFDLPPVTPMPGFPGRTAGDCDPLPESEISPLIDGVAASRELDPQLLRSMVKQESGFRPCAVSSKGAIGLMQLMPATASQLGVRNPFDPRENLDAGARFFRQLLTLYGDLPTALAAYNAGPSKTNADGGVPQIPETLNYVRTILSALPAGK